MNYSIDKIRDNRTERKARSDYWKAQQNEQIVISSLHTYYVGHGVDPSDINYSKIDHWEKFADGRKHQNPDYYFTVEDKTSTYEIKVTTTGKFHNDIVYIKPAPIFTMKLNPEKYPNSQILVAKRTSFARMPIAVVLEHPLEEAEEWSNKVVHKKAFHIPEEDFMWESWLVPIDLYI